ncbi:MAG TPA: phage holin family protein [candidate division Zixibacteria bacterium]|nr:phage holin family protein [candidate division Zixibacteria bacterium]
MSQSEPPRSAPDPAGIAPSFRAAAAAAAAALHTRLELLTTELQEERERLRVTLLLSLLLFFGLSLGVILLTVFAAALFWQAGWVYALGALAALYLAIGIGAGLLLRRRFLAGPPLLSATLAELAKDCERLRSSVHE